MGFQVLARGASVVAGNLVVPGVGSCGEIPDQAAGVCVRTGGEVAAMSEESNLFVAECGA